MRKFYSVALEATGYSNDTFNGTETECRVYMAENGYTFADGRIEEYTCDGDEICTTIITE